MNLTIYELIALIRKLDFDVDSLCYDFYYDKWYARKLGVLFCFEEMGIGFMHLFGDLLPNYHIDSHYVIYFNPDLESKETKTTLHPVLLERLQKIIGEGKNGIQVSFS